MDHMRDVTLEKLEEVDRVGKGPVGVESEPEDDAEGLDPVDWSATRELGHRIVDDLVERWRTIRERPVWQTPQESVRAALRQAPPEAPEGAERAYQDFLNLVMKYPTGNLHPRFWGWVMGTGTPLGAFADLLASGLNCNVFGANQVACLVEQQALDWMKVIIGFPADASGLFTTGGSMANVIGLAVAARSKAECDLREDGVAAAPRPMRIYASTETHNCCIKAIELLGLGRRSVRLIPIGDDYRIDLSALEDAVSEDRENGLHPFCVIGNAVTVNTGAVDDLEQLTDLCRDHGLWLHVDAAIGGVARLSETGRRLLKGMERADSVAFDLHKWLYIPYDAGCVLVREAELHRRAFVNQSEYLSALPGGLAAVPAIFNHLGPELSRSFRALKIWMSIKEHGLRRYGANIERNFGQARYLARLVEDAPELELLAPVSANIVCYRYRGAKPAEGLNEINKKILIELQEAGIAVPSHTTLGGRFALRVCITNHRTRFEDLHLLVEETLRIGRMAEGIN
jgi:aromatic-L-amino-acid decarboxylase